MKKILMTLALERLGISAPALSEAENRQAVRMLADPHFAPLIAQATFEVSKAAPSVVQPLDKDTKAAFEKLPGPLRDVVYDVGAIGRRHWRESRVKELNAVRLPNLGALGLNLDEQKAVLRMLETGETTPQMTKQLEARYGAKLHNELMQRIFNVRSARKTARELAVEAGSDFTSTERATMDDNVFVAAVSERSRQSAARLSAPVAAAA